MAWGIAGEISSTGPIRSSKRTSTQQDIPSASSERASSTITSSFDPRETRTTLTGKPITRSKHNDNSSMMFAEGGGFGGSNIAGANLLPSGYTDSSLVHIPIKVKDLDPPLAADYDPIQREKTHRVLFSKLTSMTKETSSRHREDVVVLEMTRGDYLKYWAKGEGGEFLPSVVEPELGRGEWVRLRREEMEERKRNAPARGKG